MKNYMKPQLLVEYIVADTQISSVCETCPVDYDCVNEGSAGYYWRNDGAYAFCDYGNPYNPNCNK